MTMTMAMAIAAVQRTPSNLHLNDEPRPPTMSHKYESGSEMGGKDWAGGGAREGGGHI
jgi:hypothetical protein